MRNRVLRKCLTALAAIAAVALPGLAAPALGADKVVDFRLLEEVVREARGR